jgi:transposase
MTRARRAASARPRPDRTRATRTASGPRRDRGVAAALGEQQGALVGRQHRTIALWKQRFAKDGLAGLAARHRGSKPTVLTPALAARIMTWTRRPPPHGATHWSTRSLGRKLGVQHTIVARAWRQAGLQPHRLER